LQQLQQKYGASFTYEGADISEVALARVKNLRFVQATYTIDLENENLFIHKKYDAVVSSEVLEHIQNWKKALSHLLSLLKPQGLLFITVPHGMKYWSANDEFAHHYRRFEIGQIEEELAQQGYEVLERICWGFPLYWLYYTVLLNHTDPSKNMNSQYSLAKKRLSDFLYLLFHIDDLFNNSLGRRLFIVARKKAKPKTVAQA
jgi:SAM-dependent methyltransferase